MKNARKSIFELERRTNLREEYIQLIQNKDDSLEEALASIKTWPYRQASTSVESFAEKHGFSFISPETDEDIIYSLELMVNLLHWAPIYKDKIKSIFDTSFEGGETFTDACNRHLDNIAFILESANMHVREISEETTPKYVIGKRDSGVDAVLESVPSLSDVLLSYLDIRNQKDENAKKRILHTIADYLEPIRRNYKNTAYNGLCDDLFVVFNKCGIRHNDKKQWNLRKADRMKLYDQAFKAAIHLLQMESTNKFKGTISELKKRFENKEDEFQVSE